LSNGGGKKEERQVEARLGATNTKGGKGKGKKRSEIRSRTPPSISFPEEGKRKKDSSQPEEKKGKTALLLSGP